MKKCLYCEKEFERYKSLSIHVHRIHKILPKDFYIQYYLHDEYPTCKCGCGELTTWKGNYYAEYIRGHISRIHNNWGHNYKAVQNSIKTRNERYIKPWNKGKKGVQVGWNKGKTKETNLIMKRMARSLSVTKKKDEKNKERIAKISREYWAKQENRDKQRARQVKYLKNTFMKNPTKPEKWFMKFLEKNKLRYVFQYDVGNYLYDFWVPEINSLVEVDGDFHHCNPDVHPKPIYEIQKYTVEHDKVKNKIAKDNQYNLIRIWENDINNNPTEVEIQIKNLI